MRRGTDLAVITNDLVTKEDAERVKRSGLIDPERVMAVETGACPHTAIREDPTLNMQAADELEARFGAARSDPDRERRRQPRVDVFARPGRLLAVRHRRGWRRRHPAQAGAGRAAVRSAGDQQDRSRAVCASRSGAHDSRSESGPRRTAGAADQLPAGRRRGRRWSKKSPPKCCSIETGVSGDRLLLRPARARIQCARACRSSLCL